MRRLLAIMILAVGGWLSYILLNPTPPPSSPPPVAQKQEEAKPAITEVFVARQDLRQGTFLRPDDVIVGSVEGTAQAAMDKGYFPSQSYRTEELSGAIIRSPVAAGSPLSAKSVSLPRGHGFLAAVLMPNMRAVVIPIADNDPSANHLFPGDYVDVLLVASLPQRALLEAVAQGYVPPDSEGLRQHSRMHHGTILENVRILAVDHNIEGARPVDFGVRRKPVHITLEVTPDQAEILVSGRRFGTLSLSLRPPGPGGPRQVVDRGDLYDRLEPMLDLQEILSQAGTRPLRIIRAGGRTEYVLENEPFPFDADSSPEAAGTPADSAATTRPAAAPSAATPAAPSAPGAPAIRRGN